jgi:hypothetical protein
MIRSYGLIALLLLPVTLMAAEAGSDEPKMVSGMSILGNDDAPKSLYIVPWKSSEIGSETKLSSNLLNADMAPVDKTVFMRELDFYNVSNAK